MATEVANLRAYLDADTRDFNRKLAGADRAMHNTSTRGSRAFAALGRAAKAGFLVAGAAVVAGAGYSIKSASDLGESMNAINVVFGKASKTIFDFGKTAAESAGLSQRAFNEAVTPIGAALQNVGYNAQQAADKSVMLTQRAADMASVFNTDLSESLGAIQAGLRGELDPLEKFGVSLNEAALQSYAVKTGMVGANEELTAAQKVQARLGLIMEQTNKVQGDFANTSGGLANQQRILRANLENTAAAFGKILLPAAIKVVNFANDHLIPVLDDFRGFIDKVSKQKTWSLKFQVVWEGVTGLIEKILFGAPAQRIRVPIDQRHFEWKTTSAGVGLLDVIQEAIETADYSAMGTALADGISESFHRAASHIPSSPEDFIRAIGLDPDHDYGKDFGRWLDKKIAKLGQELNPQNWKWGNLGKWLSDQFAFPSIEREAKKTWTDISNFASQAAADTKKRWSSYFEWTNDKLNALGRWFRDKWHAISGFIGDATDAVRNFFQWIGNGIDKVAGPLGKIADAFGAVKSGIGKLNPFGDGVIGASLGAFAGASSISPTLADDLALGQASGLTLSSGYRPGATTSSGNPSLHGVYPSKAIDMMGSESAMRRFFLMEVARGALTGLREVIHSPYWWHPGSGIQTISDASVMAGHYSHVHVGSYDQGGYLRPGWNYAYNGTGRNEPVGFGGITVNVGGSVIAERDLHALIRRLNEEHRRRGGV